MFFENEIRESLNDKTTARGKAESLGQEINLDPKPYEVDMATKARAEGYIDMNRMLSDLVRDHKSGISKDELEAVEYVRTQLRVMARNVYIDLAMKG